MTLRERVRLMHHHDNHSSRITRRRLVPPAATFTLLAATSAMAQQELPEMVVTATRVPIPAEQSGSAITVITGEELEQRQIRVVADALRGSTDSITKEEE